MASDPQSETELRVRYPAARQSIDVSGVKYGVKIKLAAGRAMAKIDDLGKFFLVGGSKIGDTDTRLRPAQSRRQRNEQH